MIQSRLNSEFVAIIAHSIFFILLNIKYNENEIKIHFTYMRLYVTDFSALYGKLEIFFIIDKIHLFLCENNL